MALDLGIIGKKLNPLIREYNWKDVVLHALSVGVAYDDLEYIHEDRLKVLPSFAWCAAFDFLIQLGLTSKVNPYANLHGEQEVFFHHPIPTEGTLTTEGTISHIYDKGVGKPAVIVGEAKTFHSNGEKLFTNIFNLLGLKDGGFGGETPPPQKRLACPKRSPDFEEEDLPNLNQPLLFRLFAGESFANHGFHVDPAVARLNGYDQVVMPGFCTYGYAVRALMGRLFPKEPERTRFTRVRFTKVLHPNVPIKTLIWKTGECSAMFRTLNLQTGDVVLDQGIVEWT